MVGRDIHYRTKSLKELLEIYAFECGRINRKDAEITQRKVVTEVCARMSNAFTLLHEGEDVKAVYRQLLKGQSIKEEEK